MLSQVQTAVAIVLWGSLLGVPVLRAQAGDCPPEEPTLYLTPPPPPEGRSRASSTRARPWISR